MTPIEDILTGALRAKADEIGPGTVPPLRLPARRRSRSLAYGGGARTGAPGPRGWRGWLAPAGCAVLVAAVAGGSVAVSHAGHLQAALNRRPTATRTASRASAALRQEAMTRNLAAAWVADQVSHDAIVSCDPLMCADLEAHGFPARNMRVLGPTSPLPLDAALVIETADVWNLFGSSLSSAYAPAVIATIGSGSARITIRLIAPHGAAAYRDALSADLLNRKHASAAVLHSSQITTSTSARTQLAAGQVDSRLLTVITSLATAHPIDIVDFGNIATGASAGIPLRYADLADNDTAAHMSTSAYLQSMLAVLATEPAQYRPARTLTMTLAGGMAVLRIEFTAPSPLGPLGAVSNRSH